MLYLTQDWSPVKKTVNTSELLNSTLKYLMAKKKKKNHFEAVDQAFKFILSKLLDSQF